MCELEKRGVSEFAMPDSEEGLAKNCDWVER